MSSGTIATMKEQCPDIPRGRPAVLVMGRLPEAGRVKTRLARRYGQTTALTLHTAFLRDTLAHAVTAATSLGGRAVFAYEGDGPPSRHGIAGIAAFPQSPGDLGQRQSAAQAALLDHDACSVITIGSDSPTLPAPFFREAWSQRETADLVVVPATDGGYVLIAVTRRHADLYSGLEWGTPRVMAALTERAQKLGLTLHRMAAWYDIDDEIGLQRLRREIGVDPGVAPHTALALEALSLDPIP
ncbi:MAG: TIGR04282 family arsenosugar biosynthesis glycosyltransferase [Acidobacteria bacterium]|nr:TIGR04282 family arsenosugar biosynthesis glycosyltransferase [Acidobacteriota bacterium]